MSILPYYSFPLIGWWWSSSCAVKIMNATAYMWFPVKSLPARITILPILIGDCICFPITLSKTCLTVYTIRTESVSVTLKE